MSKRRPDGNGRKPHRHRESAQRERARKAYELRTRALRPLVDIPLPSYDDATGWARRKVKAYSDYIFGRTDRKGRIVQPGIASGVKQKVRLRKPDALEKLQRELNQGELPGIRYAFVPTTYDPKTRKKIPVKIKNRKDKPDIIRIGSVSNTTLPFNLMNLISDPHGEADRLMDELEQEISEFSIYRFQIQNGTHHIAKFYTRDGIHEALDYLMHRYGDDGPFVPRSPTRHFENWLFGLTIQGAHSQHEVKTLEQNIDDAKLRTKAVRKLNVEMGGVLDTLDKLKGHAPTEPIARTFSGDAADKRTRELLDEARSFGLVSGDDNRWSLTSQGKVYVKDLRALLPYL